MVIPHLPDVQCLFLERKWGLVPTPPTPPLLFKPSAKIKMPLLESSLFGTSWGAPGPPFWAAPLQPPAWGGLPLVLTHGRRMARGGAVPRLRAVGSQPHGAAVLREGPQRVAEAAGGALHLEAHAACGVRMRPFAFGSGPLASFGGIRIRSTKVSGLGLRSSSLFRGCRSGLKMTHNRHRLFVEYFRCDGAKAKKWA